jgi:hypothetical protein
MVKYLINESVCQPDIIWILRVIILCLSPTGPWRQPLSLSVYGRGRAAVGSSTCKFRRKLKVFSSLL